MARTGLDHTTPNAPEQSLVDWESELLVIPATLQECMIQLKEAKSAVKDIVKDSFAQRDSERRERIRELEESSSPTDQKRAKILRRLRNAEDIKSCSESLNLYVIQRLGKV
jgi:hypothetical protein